MKKILFLGLALALFTFGASAQKGNDRFRDHSIHQGFKKGKLTQAEKFKLHRNDIRYKKAERKFKRDGYLNRSEKRQLMKMKQHDRRETFRYKHNRHRRVI